MPQLRVEIPAQQIALRVMELGAVIARDVAGIDAGAAANAGYDPASADAPLYLIGVLKGSCIFMADLARAIPLPVRLDFIAVSSYGEGTESSGEVRLIKDLDSSIEGADVILVEDIVDTGTTLRYLISLLQQRRPRSLRVAALLDKPSRRQVDVAVDYLGFTIPDAFVVGYGLDYAQDYRNLPHVCVLEP